MPIKKEMKSKVSCRCGLCGKRFSVDREVLNGNKKFLATQLTQDYAKYGSPKIKITTNVQLVGRDICMKCSKEAIIRLAADQAEDLGMEDVKTLLKGFLVGRRQ